MSLYKMSDNLIIISYWLLRVFCIQPQLVYVWEALYRLFNFWSMQHELPKESFSNHVDHSKNTL